MDLISIDDFRKIELKTAEVISVEKVENSSKLLKLRIKLKDEERNLVAGIAEFYSPEEILGKTIIIVANLQPRVIKGIESQGMLLAVQDNKILSILSPEKKVSSGLSIE